MTDAAHPPPQRTAGASADARWGVTAILLFAVTTAFFDRINIAVLFSNREFQADIGVSNPALMGFLMQVFVLPYGISMLLFSMAGDVLGARRTLSAIAAMLAAAMAFMGAASSYAVMVVGRIVIGVAEGPQFGAATATVKRWFPPREQAVANACWTIGSPLGSMIGFPLVILIVSHYGWRASFFALAALNALIVLPVIWLFLKDKPAEPVALTAQERRIPFAEAFRILARDWRFWLLPINNSGTLIYLWGFNSWLPSYLQQARGFNVAMTGFYSALPFAFMIAGQFFFAWIGDKTGRRAAACGMALCMAGVFIYLAAAAPGANLAAWYLAISAGFWGGATPPLFALSMQIIPKEIAAAGVGFFAGIANIVGSFAPTIMGILIAATGDFTAGLMFLVFSCIACSLAMLPLVRTH